MVLSFHGIEWFEECREEDVRSQRRRSTQKDSKRNEIHVCDNVVSAEANETHDGEPDGDDLGYYFARGEGEEYRHTDEPVTWWK